MSKEQPKVIATLRGRQIEFDNPDTALLFIAHFADPLQFLIYHVKLKGNAPTGKLQKQLKAQKQEFQDMLQTLSFTDGTPLREVLGKGDI